MNRREVLEAAIKCVCNDRQDQHGNPENTFSMIADLWEMYLCHKYETDITLSPDDVCVMMVLFKVARFGVGKHNNDNAIDGAGYFSLANELRSETENRRSQSLSEAFNFEMPSLCIRKEPAFDSDCGK